MQIKLNQPTQVWILPVNQIYVHSEQKENATKTFEEKKVKHLKKVVRNLGVSYKQLSI